MPHASRVPSSARRTLVLVALAALTACLGDLAQPRGVVGEAAIDLRGLRMARQTAGDTSNEVQSARFTVYLVSGTQRREVASRLFTAQDLDKSDASGNTTFTLTFPYNSPDDKFEVEGRGFSAQGDTLYKVGPASFTMKSASPLGGQAVVAIETAPVYVGPGVTAKRVEITPRSVTTIQGKSTALSVALYDASGKALTSPTFRFDWWTSDGSVARFMDGRVGVVTGGERTGTAYLHVRFEPMALHDSVLVTNTIVPAQIKVIDGAQQAGFVGQTLPRPLVVQVLSSNGTPIPGVTVNFSVVAGGGTLSVGSRVSSTPDATVSVTWTLGATVGMQQVEVSVAGIPTVFFTAVASLPPAPKATVTVLPTAIESGGETATVTALLKDNNTGQVMPGTAVTFGGPAWANFSPVTVVTNAAGVATTQVSATQAGTMQITASVAGVVVGTASLDVGSRQGIPASISVVSGDNQTVKIGQLFPLPLVVVVRDAAGKPVPGALVDWGTAVGDGRKVTDANGQSSATYYLTSTWPAGPGTVTVSLTGFGKVATFTFTAVP